MEILFPHVHFSEREMSQISSGKQENKRGVLKTNSMYIFKVLKRGVGGCRADFPSNFTYTGEGIRGGRAPGNLSAADGGMGMSSGDGSGICCQQAAPLYSHTSRSLPTVITPAVRSCRVPSISMHLYTGSSHHREETTPTRCCPCPPSCAQKLSHKPPKAV